MTGFDSGLIPAPCPHDTKSPASLKLVRGFHHIAYLINGITAFAAKTRTLPVKGPQAGFGVSR